MVVKASNLFGDGNWIPSYPPLPLEKPEPIKATGFTPYPTAYMRTSLRLILTGEASLDMLDRDCLKLLVTSSDVTGSLIYRHDVIPEFMEQLNDADEYLGLSIVGAAYRSKKEQSVLYHKNKKTLCLLMREPGNKYDKNAVAVLVASADEKYGQFSWYHVGYLPKHVAKRLAPNWYIVNGVPVLIQTTMKTTAKMASIPTMTFENEYSSEIKFRDVSNIISERENDEETSVGTRGRSLFG